MRKPPVHKGFKRILKASIYSTQGILAAIKNEAAFRQELVASLLTLPLLYFIPCSPVLKLMIIAAHLLILIVEMLNSAIEAVVDLVSPDYHELAKQAKDMGSGAVFLGLILAGILWGYALFSGFCS